MTGVTETNPGRMAMQESILQSIGKTPLVRLRRVVEGLKAEIYAKMESLNPGGSVKDRVALAMVAEAERRGWLRPGGTIIEATAGNTGVGLAMIAAVKGYRCIFVLPDKMSSEKIPLLKAYDPEGSVLSGDSPHPWKVEGIGEDFVPKTFNSQLVDEWIRVSDAESFHTARALAKREGMMVGGSSGTAVAAALRYGRRLTGDHLIVALCADTGRNYMSKMFDEDWLAANKLLTKVQTPHS